MKGIFMLYMFINVGLLQAQTIEDYIQLALVHNPGLKARAAEYEAFLQKIPQARSIPDLEITGEVVTKHMVYPEGNQLFGLTAMQMFPWFGKLEALEAAAEKKAQAYRSEWDNDRNELIFQMHLAWYPWLELGALIKNKQDYVELLRQLKEVATFRYQQGQIMLSEVIMSDLMIQEVETEIALLQAKVGPTWAEFARWIGTYVEPPPLNLNPVVNLKRPENPVVDGNPQLAIYDQKILAAQAEALAIKKDQLPMLGAGVRYLPLFKRGGHDFHLEPNTGAQMIMPMVAVSLPLFGKRFAAGQKEMAYMQTAYQEMKTDMLNDLNSKLSMASYEMQQAQNMQSLYDKQIEKLTEAIELMQVEYQTNANSLRDILQVYKEIIRIQELKVKAITMHNQAAVTAQVLTGHFNSN